MHPLQLATSKPWVAYGLIAANLSAFALELANGGTFNGIGSVEILALGANFAPLTRHGEPWRLATAMFLHFGAIHLGLNMLCLYQIRFVEQMVGRAQFLALYFASGLLGGLASLATHPNAVSAGASGAVFGMFGAFTAVMVVRRRQMAPAAWQSTMRSLLFFFAINTVIGASQSGIDLSAHIGGLAAGLAFAFALEKTATPAGKPMLGALVVAMVGAGTAFGGLSALPP